MTTQAHDVVVVGAGISGLTLGICLHRVGIDVLLVDKVQPGSKMQTEENQRWRACDVH